MGTTRSDPLIWLYTEYIGRPSTWDEVYGYWLFIAGLVTAFVGIALVLPTDAGETLRGVGLAIAAIGLVLLLIGPILWFPLPRLGRFVSYLGSLLSLLAVVWFANEFYRGTWSVDFDNNEPVIIALYGGGVLAIMLGALLIPILSGSREQERKEQGEEADSERARAIEEARRQARQVAEERGRQMLREAELKGIQHSQSQFELYTDRAGEHRWRLRHRNRNVIATSGEGYSSRQKAEQGLNAVKRDASGAALVDLNRTDVDIGAAGEAVEGETAPPFLPGVESEATFETYQDESEAFRWQLVDDDGTVIADSSRGYSGEQARDDAIEYVRHYAGPADYLRVAPAAFEICRDRAGQFQWRLLGGNGEVLADSGKEYASRQAVRRSIDRIRRNVADSGGAEFGIYRDPSGDFAWRLVHENDNIVANSAESYAAEERAREAVEHAREAVSDAHVVDIGCATFEIYEDTGGDWRWRLRHRNGSVIAEAGESYDFRDAVEGAILSVKRNSPRASVQGRVS